MKLYYSLLMLTKNTKKSKNNLKAPKKSKIVIFPGHYCHVNKTSQQYTALYTTYFHVLDDEIKAIAANWCLIVRTWGVTPAAMIVCPTLGRRHQHMAQCCRNIRLSFSKCLLGVDLGLKRISRNVDKKYF